MGPDSIQTQTRTLRAKSWEASGSGEQRLFAAENQGSHSGPNLGTTCAAPVPQPTLLRGPADRPAGTRAAGNPRAAAGGRDVGTLPCDP